MKNIIINRDSSHQNLILGSTFNSSNEMMSRGQTLLPLVNLGEIQPYLSKPYSTNTYPRSKVLSANNPCILTLDLETRRLANGSLEVISSCIYDGNEYITHYLIDYDNQNEMLTDIVKILTKYNGYSLYVHNFSRFDGIFLFKYIIALKKDGYQVSFLKREDKFIKISILKKGDNPKEQDKFNLAIYDSYLLLPNSLSTLGMAFNVEGKLEHNVLNHDQANLNDLKFKDKLLAYNKQDCLALYNVILTFNKTINELFKIEVFNVPTLPSLAFKVWKSRFVSRNIQIPITWWEDYNNYKEAYQGGAVDVYKPYGTNLYYYDVNSLYPYVMMANKFPTGQWGKFWGARPLKDIFGLVCCKVTAPDNLYAPILLIRHNASTIAPTGSWIGWYCSEELKLAVTYGYKIEIIKGYNWEVQSDLFSKYVNKLYEIRLTYPKSDPRNTICKLLLNSLYGKFGMSPTITEYEVLDNQPIVIGKQL